MRSRYSLDSSLTVQGVLGLVNRDSSEALLQAAARCDHAKELFRRGLTEDALEMVLPLATSDNALIRERASLIAVMILDDIAAFHEQHGNYQLAIRYLEQWADIDPEDLFPQLRVAEIYWLDLDDAESACRLYRAITRRYSNCVEAWIGLAQIALHLRRYKSAYRYLERAWASLRAPKWAYPATREIVANVMESLYELTARLLIALGDRRSAEQVLQDGIDAVGTDSPYLLEALEIVRQLTKD